MTDLDFEAYKKDFYTEITPKPNANGVIRYHSAITKKQALGTVFVICALFGFIFGFACWQAIKELALLIWRLI